MWHDGYGFYSVYLPGSLPANFVLKPTSTLGNPSDSYEHLMEALNIDMTCRPSGTVPHKLGLRESWRSALQETL